MVHSLEVSVVDGSSVEEIYYTGDYSNITVSYDIPVQLCVAL